MRVALALVLVSAVASANKPAPKNLKVFMDGGKLWATRDGIRIPVQEGPREDWQKVRKLELSDDGKTLRILARSCGIMDDSDDDDWVEQPMAELDAKFENAIGMGHHNKKQYDQAIAHFTKAVALNEQPVYVTNLLSAQSMGKKLDDADAAIARYGPHAPGWLAWRLAVDSDLAALKGRASTKPYAIAKPGTAHSDRDQAAYSPVGIAAISTSHAYEGIPSDFETFVDIVDAVSGTRLMLLPTGTECVHMGVENEPPEMTAAWKKCVNEHRASNKKLHQEVDQVYAQLGLSPMKLDGEGPDAGFTVGKVTVSRIRGKNLTTCADGLYYQTVGVATK